MSVLASIEGATGADEKAALIALTLLAAAAVLLRPARARERLRAGLLLATATLTPPLLAIDVWDSPPARHLRDRSALAAAALAAALALVGALALLFARRPALLPLAAVFALPFRIPISSDGTTANLLVPLYAVVAAGVIAYCVPRLRPAGGRRPDGEGSGGNGSLGGGAGTAAGGAGARDADKGPSALPALRGLRVLVSPRTLEWALMAAVVLYAVQAAYSAGFSKALQNVVFFYVPFALLLALLRDARWTRALLARCVAISVALAAVLAGVGFVEYARKALLLNSKLVATNVYGNYFRVNSLFYDPNIYGRYLALVMVLLAAAALRASTRRQALLCAAALAWLWAGLLTSISQTSMVALLAGLAVLAGWRWGARRAAYAAGALALVGVALLLAAPSSLHFGVTGRGGSVDNATSGRANLVRGGIDLFAERPLAGFGSGSFAQEYRARQAATLASSTSASHTTPITVAAEQGLLGIVLYLALVLCGLGVLFAPAGRAPPRAKLDGERAAIGACFVVLLVHTMAYADFLEDPIAWALLGIGIALATAARAAHELAHVEAPSLHGAPDGGANTIAHAARN